ncbi:MAG: outer membrane protein assembly factor BamD [Proteobacteria bacterium]|nr:outer membrane protein assembly factor BamD [Pseudomonadota bacterium]MBI3496572.1 outer membrane protein assembly factor BamD [Pseudomonadota bacterium]
MVGPVRNLLVGSFALIALAACSAKDTAYVERPVETIYNAAMDQLDQQNYPGAAALFDEVERQHPYSGWATKAQLMAAYSQYQNNRYDPAIASLDHFIELHPSNRDIAYAYYLKGLCYYEQITDVGRDQQITEKALKALDEVVRRFPESKYARDARLKVDLTRNHLAGKEMDIGRYYLTRGQYLAAINRFRRVVEEYQTTEQVPEALHRLTEAYLRLGVRTEAQSAAAVLGYNYPGSDWYHESYVLLAGEGLTPVPSDRSWLGRMWSRVF